MTADSGGREWENLVVLQVIQALLGLISKNMKAISVRVLDSRIILYFALEGKLEDDDEEIQDIMFELDAIFGGSVQVDVEIYIGLAGLDWPGRSCRPVYWAKE